MNQEWQELLLRAGARFADYELVDFGDAHGELIAARDATVLVPLSHLGVIRAGGEDSATFLHGLLTNDVKQLGPGAAQWNAACSPKGRMVASFLIWRDGDDYLLQCAREILAGVLKKLAMYVLRAKVKLGDASETLCKLGIAGAHAESALQHAGLPLPAGAMAVDTNARGRVIRLAADRFEVAVEPAQVQAIWASLSGAARPAGSPVWRWIEINAGIPQIGARTQEEFVPQMANFELIGGVSFQKGCYPGQEIVARTQYLGKLKRRMYLAHLPVVTTPEIGANLYSPDLPDQPCGIVVNAAAAPEGGHDLLAVMQMSSAEAGDVRLERPDGPRLSLRPLPYAVN